jgi:hypothetical protein
LWRAAAERGDLELAHDLGALLNQQGDPEAEKWWRRAADAGLLKSADSLANLKKTKGDLHTATHYWRIAADRGDESSAVQLGRLLLDQGRIEEAEQRIRPAAERGNADAAEALAQLFARQGRLDGWLQWIEKAARAGQPQAAHQLAIIAAQRGDMAAALDWWVKAAHGGDAAAMAKLAELLRAANHPEAEQWLEKAAEFGDGGAAVALCRLRLARGDEDGARRALAPAAEQEAEQALRALALLDADEDRIRRLADRQFPASMKDLSALAALRGDAETSYRWLTAAASRTSDGDTLTEAADAAIRAGDRESAERWLRAAARQGKPEAAHLLARTSRLQHKRRAAAKWQALAERLDGAELSNRVGQAAFNTGNQDEAVARWMSAAQAGSADTAARL